MHSILLSKPARLITWFIFNSLLIGGLILGNVFGIVGLLNISLFLIWMTIAIVLIIAFNEPENIFNKNTSHIVRVELDLFVDVITLLTLVYFGYLFTGVFWFIQMILSYNMLKNENK